MVLTSGGDAPGMNAAIRSVVLCGISEGFEVYAAIGGYKGLICDDFKRLTLLDVENIIHLGGTIIKSSRSPEFMTDEGFNRAVKNFNKHKFDSLVVLGGDGSMKGAIKLMEAGVKTICLPCTIDNDMSYTDITIGLDSACNTIIDMLKNVRETSASYDRVCVVEVMGRMAGDIALNAGTAAGAELILVPEIHITKEEIVQKLKKSVTSGEKCVLVVVAEGFGSAEEIAKLIKQEMQLDVKSMSLGYVQRGGSPSAFERIYATKLGARAVELIKQNIFGTALGFKQGKIVEVGYEKAVKSKHKLDRDLYNINNRISI